MSLVSKPDNKLARLMSNVNNNRNRPLSYLRDPGSSERTCFLWVATAEQEMKRRCSMEESEKQDNELRFYGN